jgi:hypothetical protein
MEVLNPKTNRMVKVGSHTYNKLVRRNIIPRTEEEIALAEATPKVEKRGRKPLPEEVKIQKEQEKELTRDVEKEILERRLYNLNKKTQVKEKTKSESDDYEREKKSRKMRNALIDTSVEIIKENKDKFKKVSRNQEDTDDLLKKLLYKKLVTDKKPKKKLKEINFDSDNESQKKERDEFTEISDIDFDDENYVSRYKR